MTTIDILGSCVSRDSFSLVKNNFKINYYFARSSIVSLYSKPMNIIQEGIELKSNFQQRILYYDLTKYFRSYLTRNDSDFLIIDLVDERFGVRQFDDSYITNSTELNQSNILKLLNTNLIKIDEEYLELWERSALKFIQDLNKSNYHKVFLHKSYYVDTYFNKEGIKVTFDKSNLHRIIKNNNMLRHMYEFIERNFPGIITIEPKGFSADENHQWGLAPYHYESDYYRFFIQVLNSNIKSS